MKSQMGADLKNGESKKKAAFRDYFSGTPQGTFDKTKPS
jgi:hypothetical protein